LNKDEPLSSSDWEPIKSHVQLGVAILRHIADLANCIPYIQFHHEHYDGTGYPSGLKGTNIPLESRILAVADAYEAMTSPRAYRKQRTHREAVEELKRNAGTQFDPEIVEVFCKIVENAIPVSDK
jgi:HD-GYP domain-containing protein (c-di-GMP phosphodiesterase class II)